MKVAVVSREHPSHYPGGFSIAAANTARAAADAGVEVFYVTAQRPDGFFGEEVRDGVTIFWMKGTTNTDYPLFHKTIKAEFPKYHKLLSFDLIHGHGYSAAPLAVEKGKHGLPVLFHDHGSKEGYVQTYLNDRMIRHAGAGGLPPQVPDFINDVYFGNPAPAGESDYTHMRRYDRVLATSSISFWDFRTRYLLTNAVDFRHCIYDLVLPPPRDAQGPHPPIVAVFAGSLDAPWKVGVHSLEKIVSMRDKVILKLIGNGPALNKWARTKFPRVQYTGHLPEKKAMQELAKVDVLFEPSTHHLGLNLTGISALGLGVPIVAYPTGGHWDMIGEDGEAGRIIDPVKDHVGRAINHVLEHRRTYGQGARRRFERIFSPAVCSEKIKAIYEGVLK